MPRKAASEIEDLEMDEDFDVEEEAESAPKSKAKSAPKGVGATQLAAALPGEVDPKTFRAWLRRKVEAGDIELDNHEAKGRYNFGNTINSPLAKKVIKLWGSESHEKGAGLKKAQASKAKGKAKAKAKK